MDFRRSSVYTVGGLLLHATCLQFVLTGMQSLLYGVLLGYLNVPGQVYSVADMFISSRPFSFTILWGALSDTVPLFGYRRKPYLILGWICTTITLGWVLLSEPLPAPFFCQDTHGRYIREIVHYNRTLGRNVTVQAPPCNEAAANAGGHLVLKFVLVTVFQGCSQAASNGLLVEYSRIEDRYGSTNVAVSIASVVGYVLSKCLIGFGMNSFEFNGTFQEGLSFSSIVAILFVVSALMIPVQVYCNQAEATACSSNTAALKVEGEDRGSDEEAYTSAQVTVPLLDVTDSTMSTSLQQPRYRLCHCLKYLKQHHQQYPDTCCLRQLVKLLSSRAVFCFVVWVMFIEAALPNVQSPAVGLSQELWAGVKVLPRSIFAVLTAPVYIFGLVLYERYGLAWSYQKAFVALTLLHVVIDAVFKYPTALGWVRNQYFTLGEDFASDVPSAALDMVEGIVSISLAPPGAEALWMGVVDMAAAAGYPLGRAVGNIAFAHFHPSLSDSANYVSDTLPFRSTVVWSYLLGHITTSLGVLSIYLIPDQKADALWRLRTWPRHRSYALGAMAVVLLGFWYGSATSVLQLTDISKEYRQE